MRDSYKQLIINIILACLYVLEYRYAYINYVIKWYGYADLTYEPINYTWLLVIQAVIPIFFFHGIKNFSSGLSFFVYVFVYVPFIVTIHLADFPTSIRVSQGIVFLVIMILYFATDSFVLGGSFYQKYRRKLSFRNFEIFVLILFAIAIVLNWKNLRFVNFFADSSLLYELRETSGISGFGRFNAYLTLWLSHGFLPILLVYYFKTNKRVKLIACTFAFIVMFMMDKQKITMLIPFVMLGLLYVLKKHNGFVTKYLHMLVIIVMSLSSFIVCKWVNDTESPIANNLSLLLIVRTQCIEGEQLDRYTRFFEVANNPYTYYTHITVLNKLTGAYPYSMSIGEAVAGGDSNSNATFLLMDGLAAMGVIGCMFISIIFVLAKAFLNSMGKRYDDRYLLVIFLFAIFSMLNTSLATSFLSFGALCIYLSLLFFDLPALRLYK